MARPTRTAPATRRKRVLNTVKAPKRPSKETFSVRISPALHRAVEHRARLEGRTKTGLVQHLLTQYVQTPLPAPFDGVGVVVAPAEAVV